MDTVSFPMNQFTNNSIFLVKYEMRDMTTFLRFMVVYTDYVNMTIICSHSPVTPVLRIKIFSRRIDLDPQIKELIGDQLERKKLKRNFIWVDKSSCDTAICTFVSSPITLSLAITVLTLLNIYIT